MIGTMALIATGALSGCSPAAIEPLMGHWTRLDKPKEELYIYRKLGSLLIELRNPGARTLTINGIQTIDGRIVVQIRSYLATILSYDPKSKTVHGGEYSYLRAS